MSGLRIVLLVWENLLVSWAVLDVVVDVVGGGGGGTAEVDAADEGLMGGEVGGELAI